jgi:hypothetical protein
LSILNSITRSPKRALGVLGTMAVAGAVVVGSGASFSYDTTNPGNSVKAGQFIVLNQDKNGADMNNQAVFTVDNVSQFTQKSFDVYLKNDGDYPADCRAVTKQADGDLTETQGTDPQDAASHGLLSNLVVVAWDRIGPEVTEASGQTDIDSQYAGRYRNVNLSSVNRNGEQHTIQPGETAHYLVGLSIVEPFPGPGHGSLNKYEGASLTQTYHILCDNVRA